MNSKTSSQELSKAVLLKTLEKEKRLASKLCWSPKGRFAIIYGFDNGVGSLEFWDFNEMESIVVTEHYMATDIEWDPSGRYVATYVSCKKISNENGYCIWDFKGSVIYRKSLDKLGLFSWRPCPPSCLSKESLKQIKRNLKDYSKQFEEQDYMETAQAASKSTKNFQQLVDEWKYYLSKWSSKSEKEKAERSNLLGLSSGKNENLIVEEWIDEVIEESECLIGMVSPRELMNETK